MWVYFCLFLCFFGFVCGNQICESMTSCQECVITTGCAWCLKTIEEELPKCLPLNDLSKMCPKNYQQNPETERAILKNDNVSENSPVVQIQPQKMQLKIRLGVKETIEFRFRKANDYALDLYYLMDFSKSMHEYKSRLSELGDTLSSLMQNLTSSFQLGFGTFVDKVAIPYTNTAPDYINNPCDNCVPTYSFKNDLPLNRNISKFIEKLKMAKMSGNMDTPEGGFDGLLQTIVCTEDINWRKEARRIIVLCTDAEFHIAGDGKLAGIVEPHDGQCHLDLQGHYTESLKFDYPSISLLNAKAKEKSMNIIFAVTKQHIAIYSKLRNAIEGAAVGVLEKSESIVSLVHDQYKKISLTLNMTHNATSSVSLDFYTKCPGENWLNKKTCSFLQGGDEVQFRIDVQISDCSRQIIEIKPIGIFESLLLAIEPLCQCPCQTDSSPSFEVNSTKCSTHGNLTCGLCDCDPNYYGLQCECFKGRVTAVVDRSQCRKNNITCSGRGDCICGKCSCHKPPNKSWRVTGKHCECDNFSCSSANGLLCSGHGICNCGTCVCDPGWTGHDCTCSLDTRSCILDETGVVCSEKGDCECGKCKCHSIPGKKHTFYSGQFCEKCTVCKIECTHEMHDCVECIVHKSGPYMQFKDQCSHCKTIISNITKIDDVSGMSNVSESSTLCRPLENDESGCYFKYVAYRQNDEVWIYADVLKICPKGADIVAIVAGVTSSTVFAGLIVLLIWKVVTTIHDKREFMKFEKERANSKWGRGDNPLYRKAVSTYLNPMFKNE